MASLALRPRRPSDRRERTSRPVLDAVWHLGLLAVLLALAEALPRLAGRHDLPLGLANARRLADAERALGLHPEPALAAWTGEHDAIAWVLNLADVGLHVPVLAGVLVWVYLRHAGAFGWLRSLFVVAMGLTVVGYALFPTAPPRFLPEFQDTAVAIYGDSMRPTGGGAVNTLAAMPSGHVLFAIVAAIPVVRLAPNRAVRALFAAYPVAIALLVVLSAHHFWLDGAVAALVAVVAAGAATAVGRLRPAWAWRP